MALILIRQLRLCTIPHTLSSCACTHVICCQPLKSFCSNDFRRLHGNACVINSMYHKQVEDDSLSFQEIAETGYRDEAGDMRRPWCPATRILEHRESQAQEAEAESRRKIQQQSYCNPDDMKAQLREDFPPIEVFNFLWHIHQWWLPGSLLTCLYVDLCRCSVEHPTQPVYALMQ